MIVCEILSVDEWELTGQPVSVTTSSLPGAIAAIWSTQLLTQGPAEDAEACGSKNAWQLKAQSGSDRSALWSKPEGGK